MTLKKFGEVELIRDETPKGIIIREEEYGVVLEECLDNNGRKVDVLHHFPKECTLKNKEDLYNCLVEARKYETDLNRPIYIKIPTEVKQEESENQNAQRRALIERLVERSGTHPWNFR